MSQDTIATAQGTDAAAQVDQVEDQDVETIDNLPPVTPYQASKIASILLGRDIRPQMLYGYASRGTIATVTVTGTKKVFFDGQAFAEWLSSQQGGTTVSGRADYDALAKQFGSVIETTGQNSETEPANDEGDDADKTDEGTEPETAKDSVEAE